MSQGGDFDQHFSDGATSSTHPRPSAPPLAPGLINQGVGVQQPVETRVDTSAHDDDGYSFNWRMYAAAVAARDGDWQTYAQANPVADASRVVGNQGLGQSPQDLHSQANIGTGNVVNDGRGQLGDLSQAHPDRTLGNVSVTGESGLVPGITAEDVTRGLVPPTQLRRTTIYTRAH